VSPARGSRSRRCGATAGSPPGDNARAVPSGGRDQAKRRQASAPAGGEPQEREEAARRALAEFPTSPATLTEARSDLLEIARVVQRLFDAAGAKIYVLRRAPEGPMLWRLCNTQAPDQEARLVPLGSDHGMADWVLRENKWLSIPHFQTPVAGVKQQGITAGGAAIDLIARPARVLQPDAPADAETSVLLVPLSGKASVTGALSVWREDRKSPPLDHTVDRNLLEQFAPHIAAACQRLLQLQKAKEQLTEMSILAAALRDAATLRDGYDAVAAGTARLADAGGALLLHHDHASKQGHRLYPTGISIGSHGPASPLPLRGMPVLLSTTDLDKWQAELAPVVSGAFSSLAFRGLLTPPAEISGNLPPLTVALFDALRLDIESAFPSDEMLGHFARAFLQSAAVLLERHVADLGSRLADELGGPPASQDPPPPEPPYPQRSPQSILERTGSLLQRATGADAALVYMGTPNHMTVRGSSPPCPELLGLPVGPHSLTRESMKEGKAKLVLDAKGDGEQFGPDQQDHEPLDPNRLRVIATKLGWRDIRSWLCCPVLHHGRVLGVVKLLTKGDGLFLGNAACGLAITLAKHAGWEMYQANRRQILESLAALSRDIAGFTGRMLGKEMARSLRRWAEVHLLRPECMVLVLAQATDGGSLVREAASQGREPFSEAQLARLESELSAQSEESFRWTPHAKTPLAEALQTISAAGCAHTVRILGVSRLQGYILFADKEAFSSDEEDAVREAARAMAVLLNSEAERTEFKQTVGRFRHATLGPIQGVQSNALSLALLVEEGRASPEEARPYRTRLEADIEALRRWRQNERFYLSGRPEVMVRPTALRPLVEHCFRRYFPALEEREIGHRLDWQAKGDLHLDLDKDAFDLALSNLLDNAVKNCFYHREVVLEVSVLHEPTQPLVQLMVEDVGHGIDEQRAHVIFEVGEREKRFDPFRIIPGEGLGLPMAKAIIEAHQGRLFCRSEQQGSGRVPDTTPFRVRFFIQLPFHQARRTW
jgi:signal transduction histidine kinase